MHLPAVLLMGPTASGKSALAAALAAHLPLEIVSVDSAQVYRDMDVGTAKPDAATRAAIPHHLIDMLLPTEAYSAQRFVTDALAAVAAIRARGRIPLLVGGTMLYFKALLAGLSDLPPANPTVRAELDAEAARRGWPALHAVLATVDPATAARLDPNDAQRIQRALEVHRTTGVPLSALQGRRQPAAGLGAHVVLALLPADRARLHAAIATRFDTMLGAGLVAEVERLRASYALRADLPSMRAVGYRQVWDTLEGYAPAGTLRDRGIAATRQLAKRQITWLRAMPAQALDPWAPGTLDAFMDTILATAARERASRP